MGVGSFPGGSYCLCVVEECPVFSAFVFLDSLHGHSLAPVIINSREYLFAFFRYSLHLWVRK